MNEATPKYSPRILVYTRDTCLSIEQDVLVKILADPRNRITISRADGEHRFFSPLDFSLAAKVINANGKPELHYPANVRKQDFRGWIEEIGPEPEKPQGKVWQSNEYLVEATRAWIASKT